MTSSIRRDSVAAAVANPQQSFDFTTAGTQTGTIPVRIAYRILELFSDGLYSSPNKAIEELVSNSFDAGAQNVHIVMSADRGAADATIAVVDDGESMDADGLEQHWLIGESRKRSLSRAERGMVRRFVDDMDKALGETARVLVRGGRATYVVGNSTIRGIFVKNSECAATLARAHGLRVISKRERRLPDNLRYLPPPSQRGEGLELRMRTEVVVRLEKPV